MSKHTPTPWRVNEQLQLICVENGYRIGSVSTPLPQSRGKERREDWEYCKGNAEHIVRCVNGRDALVKTLENTRELLALALERMDLARNIITGGNPRPECNWGILDTSDLSAKLVLIAAAGAPQ